MSNRLLKSDRIYLRLIEREDLPQRVEWLNDPDIQLTTNYDFPTSLGKTQKWYEGIIMDPTRRDFSIFTCKDNECIGFCGFIHIDRVARKAESYRVIGKKEYWGKGVGTESNRLLTHYGFTELGLNRIYAYHLSHNLATQRVLEKLGWKSEGILRQNVYSHGRLWDQHVVSILRDEWENLDLYPHENITNNE